MKIFISYAHEDTPHVLDLTKALERHEVWYDRRLLAGQEWWREIEGEIAACHCFMFMLSPRSLNSEYCQKELDIALRLGKAIAPILLEDMPIPEKLSRFQAIHLVGGLTQEVTVRLLNGLFEIESQVFNPFKPQNRTAAAPTAKLSVTDLYFATTNPRKKQMYEQILNVQLQTASLHLDDIQHLDTDEVAIDKVRKAYNILQKPVFVDHSALAIRAWGGLPGGLTTTFIRPAGLNNICKMLRPFDDKYAEAISVIAFTDGYLIRKFMGIVPGEIPDTPRGAGYSWNNIFVPKGFDKTLGEMSENEMLAISSRRLAMIEFMRFLQSNYEFVQGNS